MLRAANAQKGAEKQVPATKPFGQTATVTSMNKEAATPRKPWRLPAVVSVIVDSGRLQNLLLIGDRLRRWLVQFNLCAYLFDLRGLLFELCSEHRYFFLLPSDRCLQFLKLAAR
jgi:hypothetical protein